ncbi:MAG: AraC family transcriptional regulator [Ginsengibacter sp.]
MDQYNIPNENNKLTREAQRVERIRQYLTQNLASDLHATTVAKKFRISLSSFHHLFKKYQGQSYHKYLEEIRMNKALALLQTEGIRIKEVMYATGYRNRSTFGNAFRKKFKNAPGYFKK